MASALPISLVVIDRDGTLIRHIPYLCDPAQVEILPTVREGLAKLQQAGCLLFLHTNQSGVGRGYFPLQSALDCNEEMLRRLDLGDGLFAEVCVSPETPDAEIQYRKPSPRFGRELLEKYGKQASELCYIGDNLSDLLTAQNLGCHGVGVNSGVHDLHVELAQAGLKDRFVIRDDFKQAVNWLLGNHEVVV